MSKQVVLGIFPDEQAADTAAHSLKEWDYVDDDVKVNAIGVLVLDDKGKINTHKLGPRTWGKGAGIGVARGDRTTDADRRSTRRWRAGRCTTRVLASTAPSGTGSPTRGERTSGGGALLEETQVTAVTIKLKELGGDVQVLRPSDDAVAEVDAVAPEVEAAEAAEGSAPPAT